MASSWRSLGKHPTADCRGASSLSASRQVGRRDEHEGAIARSSSYNAAWGTTSPRATSSKPKPQCDSASPGGLGNVLIDKNRIAVGIDQDETRGPGRRFVGLGLEFETAALENPLNRADVIEFR